VSRRESTVKPIFDNRLAESQDRQLVVALARGLEVLRAFERGDHMLGNRDIAERTGLPKATVSRLTYTLTRLGYLNYHDKLGKYELGTGVLALGYAFLANLDLRQWAREAMQTLANETHTTVAMGSRDRLSMIYLLIRRGPGAIGLGHEIGDRIPIATTGIGRAYIAALDQGERQQLLDSLRDADPTAWPQQQQALERALEDYQQYGYCLSLGEWHKDINSAGVALRSSHSPQLLAFNIAGLASRVTEEQLRSEFAPRLVLLVQRLQKLDPQAFL